MIGESKLTQVRVAQTYNKSITREDVKPHVDFSRASSAQIEAGRNIQRQQLAQASQFVANIAKSSALNNIQKATLVDVAAIVDQFINNPTKHHKLLKDIAGMGIFLEQKSERKFPDYPQFIGLRYYNEQREALSKISLPEADVEKIVEQKLSALSNEYSLSPSEVLESIESSADFGQKLVESLGSMLKVDVSGVDSTKSQSHAQSVDVEA